jgi:hypothetical protein
MGRQYEDLMFVQPPSYARRPMRVIKRRNRAAHSSHRGQRATCIASLTAASNSGPSNGFSIRR